MAVAAGAVLLAGLTTGCQPAGGTAAVGPGTNNVVFTAAAGQANSVTFLASGDALIVSDTGDEVQAGEGCTQIDEFSVRCTKNLPDLRFRLFADLSDGSDHATNTTSADSEIDGGPGNDTLDGGSNTDRLTGAAGRDVLNGNGGRDLLYEAQTQATADLLDADTFIGRW